MINLTDIFIKHLPTLDLHGTTRDIARVLTKDFIDDNQYLKHKKVVIIHGIGEGIVKEEVHKELGKNKSVIAYHVDPFNSGITVITINLHNRYEKVDKK